MALRTLSPRLSISGKRVLVRASLNVSLERGTVPVHAAFRLKSNMQTLSLLKRKGARAVIIGHLGRPSGKRVSSLSFLPLKKIFERVFHAKLRFIPHPLTSQALRTVAQLPRGGMALIENIRFFPGEERNLYSFAQKLSRLGDIFINEAFADSASTHASVVGVTTFLPSYAGLHFAREVRELTLIREHYRKPRVVIIGGVKISSKLSLLSGLVRGTSAVLLGGHVANIALFLARGEKIVLPRSEQAAAKNFLTILKGEQSIMMPCDLLVREGKRVSVKLASQVTPKDSIIDIGPETVTRFLEKLENAKTVLWNGPMGITEQPEGREGTHAIARALAKARSHRVAGGGETITYLSRARLLKRFSFISTGGGAMLSFLAGERLPGAHVLEV